LLYHEYPSDNWQDFVSAQWNRTQTKATESFSTDFLAFSPYQTFSIYNLGYEPGTYYLEISKAPSGPTVLFWILIGLLIFSVVTLLVSGVFAIWYYVMRRPSGYAQIR
jgi:hypothetical protein